MDSLAERDAAVFFAQAGSTPVRHAIRHAEGVWIEDDTGHRMIDLHGNTCHNLGHAHPSVVAAVRAQLDDLCFAPRRFTCAPAVRLAERLVGLWPHGPAKVLFGLSGSDAIEMALKLAWGATGRRRTLGFAGAWHGAGLAGLWAGGRPRCRLGFPELDGCVSLPAPWTAGGRGAEAAAQATLMALRAELGGGDVACLIAEPVGAAHKLPPDWFWPEAAAALEAAGALLIFDEVPTGLGRTGHFFAHSRYPVRPAMTVLGKSLGGGVVPLSALVAEARLDTVAALEIGHYTHQKSPVLAAAGLAVLDVIADDGLVARAAAAGARLRTALDALVARQPALRAAHGVGLLAALELARPGTGEGFVAAARAQGLNLTAGEDGFVALSPPLTASDADLDAVADRLDAAAGT